MAARPAFAFKLEGLRDLEAALGEVSKSAGRRAIVRALEAAARPVADATQARAAVATGDLKGSIDVGTRLSRRQRGLHRKESAIEVFVGAGALPQAHLLEFGTISQAPRPFLRPAWDANRDRVLTEITAFLAQEVEATARRARRRAAGVAGRRRS